MTATLPWGVVAPEDRALIDRLGAELFNPPHQPQPKPKQSKPKEREVAVPITVYENAKRENMLLRGFLMGPQGGGKSRGALELATRLADNLGVPVVLINSERGRGHMYADRFRVHLLDMADCKPGDEDFSPEEYIKAIDLAESQWPGAVLVIDSVTHEWAGTKGTLQQVDKKFGEWKDVRPRHRKFIDRMNAYNGHLIVTCRAKMKYDVTEEPRPSGHGTRQVVTMLGVGPVQDGDLEYEFNLVGRLDRETNECAFSGHLDPLKGVVSKLTDAEGDRVCGAIVDWLSEGEPPAPPEEAPADLVAELVASLKLEEMIGDNVVTDEFIEQRFARQRMLSRGVLPPEYVRDTLAQSKARLAAKLAAQRKAEPEPAAA